MIGQILSRLTLFAFVIFESNAAAVLVEKDHYKIDWATSRLKYESKGHSTEGFVSYELAEKLAWKDGISNIRKIAESAFLAHYADKPETLNLTRRAGLRAAKNVFSMGTQYTSEGTVNVALEAQLSNILGPFDLVHSTDAKPDYKKLKTITGIIFVPQCDFEPRADVEIEDESGRVVYSPSKISKVAYSEVLVGRWYRRPKRWQLRRSVGENPKTVTLSCHEGGRLKTSKGGLSSIPASEKDIIIKAARVVFLLK